MKILSIDPSLVAVGIVAYDTETGVILLSKTLVFNKKDKTIFLKELLAKGAFKNINPTEDLEKNNISEMWVAHRLNLTCEEIKKWILQFDIDVVVTEAQINDKVVKSVSAINIASNIGLCGMVHFRPTEWKKIVTGKGNIKEEPMLNIILNIINQPHVLKLYTEHEIDCYGLLIAYIKTHNIDCKYIRKELIGVN